MPGVLKTVGIVEVARVLRQITGMGDVEHLAFDMLELLQGQRRLTAAGAADRKSTRLNSSHQ